MRAVMKCRALEDRSRDFPRLAAYLRERAEGGVGLMVTGGVAPEPAFPRRRSIQTVVMPSRLAGT